MGTNNRNVPERLFMKCLLKHTGIALVILIPIAMYSSFAKSKTPPLILAESQVSTVVNHTNYDMPSSPTAVEHIDLNKYAGKWYEIARFPMYFQRKCASDVTATYTLQQDEQGDLTSVNILNQCRKADHSFLSAKGIGLPIDGVSGKLKVDFKPQWLQWLPVGKADYWILAIDDDYKKALVGTPDNKYLWILSRTPTLDETTFNAYKTLASHQGYDMSKLKVTTHMDGTDNIKP